MNKSKRAGLIRENLEIAIEALSSHKLRSGLVILGIAIGVASLMSMISLVLGLKNKIVEEISSAEQPVLMVQKYDQLVGGIDESMLRRKEIAVADARALQERCPSLSHIAYIVQRPLPVTLRYKDEKTRMVQIVGTQPSLIYIQSLDLDDGRMFTDAEVSRSAKVIVISHSPRRDLFPNVDPIGKKIRIENDDFLVVGTFGQRKTLVSGADENFAVIPYTTYKATIGEQWDPQSIAAAVRRGVSMEAAREEVIQAMRRQRKLKANKDNDFAVTSSDAALDLISRITAPIALVVSSIASIALLVAGIGVMNIMLVSVIERTIEIGIRKAVGAEGRDILWQFLVEAGTLTGFGGIAGVVLGLSIAMLISLLSGIPFSLAPLYIFLSVSFSVVIGVFFGLYPAIRASKLNPIKAIGYAK